VNIARPERKFRLSERLPAPDAAQEPLEREYPEAHARQAYRIHDIRQYMSYKIAWCWGAFRYGFHSPALANAFSNLASSLPRI
jgi:hypothetical protein